MSVVDSVRNLSDDSDLRAVLLRLVFGDLRGLAVFLGGLCFFTLYWRVGVFITDTNAILNTLVNVADGHLYIAEAPYGSGKISPGTYVSDGRAYGRNYGVVFAALPVYLGIQALSSVVDIGILLVGIWPLTVIALTMTVGSILDRTDIAVAGSAIALVGFGINVTLASPVGPGLYPVLALQIVTLVATGFTGVFIYRLLARMHTPRTGVLAAAGAFLATPLSFWAAFPKRHAFTALLLFASAYAFYQSRADPAAELRYRSLAYVPVGLMTWIHSAEALTLFLPLLIVDVATAERNDRRSLGIVALVFLLSLVPFFLTNFGISGNPVEPPRMLTPYDQANEELSMQGGSSPGFFGDGPVGQALSKVVSITSVFGSQLLDGTIITLTDPTRLFQTLIRSGFLPEVAAEDNTQAISLTMLESAPILGALVGIPLFIGHRLKQSGRSVVPNHLRTPAGAMDMFAAGCGFLLFALYIPRLPLHAQATVRYLHPLYPLGIYALARLPPVREVAEAQWRPALWSYLGGVFIGGQLVILTTILLDPGFGEIVQLHALIALATATLLVGWTVTATVTDSVPDEYGGVAMGLTAAAASVFVLMALLFYFSYATVYAVPLFRLVFENISLV